MPRQIHKIRTIDPLEFPAFIQNHPITVVYARRWVGEFNKDLHKQLTTRHRDIACIQVDLIAVDAWRPFIDSFIGNKNQELGRNRGAAIQVGYYLFLDGGAVAFDPCLLDWEKDQLSLGIGALFSLAGLFGDKPKLVKGGVHVGLSGPAFRVAEYFGRCIRTWNTTKFRDASREAHRRRQRHVTHIELMCAFARLEASPDDGYEEVKKKRKRLLRKFHPDLATSRKKGVSHEESIAINRAWEIVCTHRGWQT